MFDPFAIPRIGDVDKPVTGLDYRWIGKFARGVFQRQHRLPGFAVVRHGNIQRTTVLSRVVISQQVAPVAQRNGVDARVRIGQVQQGHGIPRLAVVGRLD